MSDRKTVLQEQSIEEILASIRKIISEDSVSGPDNRIEEETKRNTDYDADEDKVLVLTESIDQKTVLDDPENILNESTPIEDETIVNKANTDSELRFEPEETFLSNETLKQRKDSISELLCNIKDVESNSFNQTLDSLTKELLKPLLKEWLDNNLPTIVDHIVRDEIKRITSVSSK